jgi:hypothetical protein
VTDARISAVARKRKHRRTPEELQRRLSAVAPNRDPASRPIVSGTQHPDPAEGSVSLSRRPNYGLFGVIIGVVLTILLYFLQANGVGVTWQASAAVYVVMACLCAWSFWSHAAPHVNLGVRLAGALFILACVLGPGFYGTVKQYRREHSASSPQSPTSAALPVPSAPGGSSGQPTIYSASSPVPPRTKEGTPGPREPGLAVEKSARARKAQSQQAPTSSPKEGPLSADDLADKLAERLEEKRLATSTNSSATLPLATPAASTVAARTPPPVSPPLQVCRGDRLSECDDAQLLQWGRPLVIRVGLIDKEYRNKMAQLRATKGNEWVDALTDGISNSIRDIKSLKAYHSAQGQASDDFRSCCAEDWLAYRKELAQRTGGLENMELSDWAQGLMKPASTDEYRKARADGSNIMFIKIDLCQLQSALTKEPPKNDCAPPPMESITFR